MREAKLDAKVDDLAFSPAGDLAVASGREVHLVTASGHTARLTIATGAEDHVTTVAFRDARTLAVGCADSGLAILTLGGGKPSVARIAMECRWHSMRWSPDGNYIAGGQYEPWVSIVDVAAGAELRVLDPDEFDDESRTAVLFTNNMLVSTAHNKLVRWRWPDVIANKAKCRMPKTGVQGYAHLLDVVALRDELVVLVETGEHASYLQHFAPSGERVGNKMPLEGFRWRLAVAGDELVVAGADTRIVGGPRDGTVIDTLDGVTALAAHGNRIAVASERMYRVIDL